MAPMMVFPSGSRSYTIYYDTSRAGLGCVLMQDGRVIAYASCQLKPHDKNYPVHNLELAAIVPQYDYPHLLVLRDTVQRDSDKKVTIGDDGVLRLQGWICVPKVDGLRELILEEAHSSWYSIYLGATKMYHDLKQHYWWRRMKKDIVEHVTRCLNYQRVKCEHQSPSSLLQRLDIPE
ncbi:uncharacterized protein [Nicotiana tomentosiformis]|uniref:uncharacterized protein n=1 Tax=Nicotiana tomentosiformis TaxID=4098 RepID=UPI00388C4AAB